MNIKNIVTMTDEEVIKDFPRYEGNGTAGFVTNFLGVKTRISFHSYLSATSGGVEGYPIPANFHATQLEWAGTLRAVLAAGEEIVAVELGAAWGPMIVAVGRAARLRGIRKIHLVGVEGAKSHWENMRDHVRDNGFDPQEYTLLCGVVGTTDGIAEFPILSDAALDLGARAVFGETDREGGSRALTEKVRCYSLPSILEPFQVVDIIHFDIQGHELEVIKSAQDVLNTKVKRIVVGTHSREIEEALLHLLPGQSWILESAENSLYRDQGGRETLWRDGCHVWRNKAFDPKGEEIGPNAIDLLSRSLCAAADARNECYQGQEEIALLKSEQARLGDACVHLRKKITVLKKRLEEAKVARAKAKRDLENERLKHKTRWKRRLGRVLPFLRKGGDNR